MPCYRVVNGALSVSTKWPVPTQLPAERPPTNSGLPKTACEHTICDRCQGCNQLEWLSLLFAHCEVAVKVSVMKNTKSL